MSYVATDGRVYDYKETPAEYEARRRRNGRLESPREYTPTRVYSSDSSSEFGSITSSAIETVTGSFSNLPQLTREAPVVSAVVTTVAGAGGLLVGAGLFALGYVGAIVTIAGVAVGKVFDNDDLVEMGMEAGRGTGDLVTAGAVWVVSGAAAVAAGAGIGAFEAGKGTCKLIKNQRLKNAQLKNPEMFQIETGGNINDVINDLLEGK